jgi:hypothetical protein
VNLESLSVAGPDNDLLRLDSTAFASLEPKSLDLKSLAMTGEALSDLFNQSKTLREVALTSIHLRSGTWEDVLKCLSLSHITSFRIESCVYDREGESAEFIPAYREQTDSDAGHIETNRAGDMRACHSVFWRMHDNMHQIRGTSYNIFIAETRRQRKHMVEVQQRALMRGLYLVYEIDTSDDDWDTSSSMDGVIGTLENILPDDDSDDDGSGNIDNPRDGSSDDDSSDSSI